MGKVAGGRGYLHCPSPKEHLVVYLLVGLTSLLGGGSLFLFSLFLFLGSLNLVNLGLPLNSLPEGIP